MKEFIKKLNLRWSDLLLLVGFLPFAIFLVFGQLFMQYPNPSDVALPLWAIIICFIVLLGSWGAYLYLEFKRGNKPHNYITWAFAFILIIGIIGVIVQPSLFVENVVVRMVNEGNPGREVGDIIPVTLTISPIHYTFFTFDIIAIILFIYIGLFIFPKRFTSVTFVKYLGYAVLVFMASLIIYSYIFEFNNYIGFFKYIFGKGNEGDNLYTYAVKSYIIHRNAYGMAMMIGIIFCFINHSMEHKWWYYLIAGYLFISMLFSVCKTGILISVIIAVLYVIYRLIVTYEKHAKRNRILIICGVSAAFFAVVVLGIAYFSKGKILGSVYALIQSLGGSSTLDFRVYIWDNSFQLLRNGWWLIGRGFGLYNEMLLPMNTVNGDPVFPAHSAYVCLLAEGGIFFLLAYIALVVYTGYVTFKCFKYNKDLAVSFSLGIIAFMLYSFIEAIQYLVYVFMFPMMILYHISKQAENRVEQ